ncbi:MAG: BREX system P-loop protein BrxC [Anaerolineales bacterium]|nr:BREX system P-loop protein BrxC [Anaerolineales bacterium]
MKLNQIFQKPVDRNIEGVIKADDETSLQVEVEEYVLTNEIAKRLEAFLDAYNNYQGANGAWVSGFFGSGKSHLLKILALLLENRSIDGLPVLAQFLPKCEDNAILRASLQKAVAIPSKSILFNIDQKADVISKTQIDALLAVFVKVFDEMCGYYGKQGYIARFERDLNKRGLYEEFKKVYRQVSGKDWEMGREEALLEGDNIATACAQVTGNPRESVAGILDKYRTEYKVSIEDFALQINEYIESQGTNFRLNFFVDEVGQYIANNTKLMTNLQTIAESLATKCLGRAWVVVTAQEDMNAVIGEMNIPQGNDFSKIQARFAIRMKLTGQNVAEVIQKRLLQKNDQGEGLLADVYQQHSNNFGTLFDFSDGSQTYRNYRDHQHFINSYPFTPYQFQLFQSAIQNLSIHNAFEGKQRSVGERSMLAVFQQVAVHISKYEIGQLATFDLMFEGIRTALKAQNQQAILTAENHLDNPFAVRVLKALFLVKYVKEFKASVHNICVLMVDRFGQDMLQLRKDVEEALNLLEQQTYIQRNGDLYEYLTNEEKDVEEEIKNTEVDSEAVSAELAKIIFDHIIRERKIRFDENNQDFIFSRKLDERLTGKDYELTIHVVSPFHEHFDSEETLRMHSMGRDELLMILPADNRLVQDLLMFKRTEKYIQQNINVTQQDTIKRILTDKSFHNRERLQNLELRVKELISRSKLFVAGDEIEINSTDALTIIVRGFHELIRHTYPNLKMLRGISYTENDIETCLQQTTGTLFGNDLTALSEAEQELLAFIQSNQRGGVRTTFKSLDERFERKPNGWSLAAIQCNLAMLYAHGKVEIRSDGNILEDTNLARALRNTHGHANLIIEPQVEFTIEQVRKLKKFFEDFFDKPPQSSEARDLGKETATALDGRLDLLTQLATNRALYPFLTELSEPITCLKELVGKSTPFYLEELLGQQDHLLEIKEKIIAPVLSFWNGPQKGLYDESRQFQQTQAPNFDYLEGNEDKQLKDLLVAPDIFKGSHMQQVRSLVETLKGKLSERLKLEKEHTAEAIRARQALLATMPEFKSLTPDQQAQLGGEFNAFLEQLEGQTLIAKIRDNQRNFEEREYRSILTQMTSWAHPTTYETGAPGNGVGICAEPKVEYISSRSIQVHFEKAWLADEKDIDQYLEALRSALVKEINNGKRVQI